MATSNFGILAKGFISGAVFTVSISYPLYLQQKQKTAPVKTDDARSPLFPFGKPTDLRQVIDYTGHTLCYDVARKQPLWVSEILTKESLKGRANRKQSKFRVDDQLPEGTSATNGDYLKSGWSRGHMAAAGNFKSNQQAMDDTFYLSNIVPQNIDNNSGFWNRLETYCRDLTEQFDKVHVISGPLYQVNDIVGDKKFVKYEVIGDGRVPAPTHLYKIVAAFNEGSPERAAVAAFVVPNIPISREVSELTKYEVSLEKLKSLTGFSFHPQLPSQTTTNLCVSDRNSCKLKSWEELELYFAMKKVKYAKSQKDIDTAVVTLKDNNVKFDQKLLSQIEKKQTELRHATNA